MEKFLGYKRPDGKVGVRNNVVVLPVVCCANGVSEKIAKEIDEVISLSHGHGCGRMPEIEMHTRTLVGLGLNPNVYGVLVVGLGCETLKGKEIAEKIKASGKPVECLIIQEEGGSRKTTEKGIKIVKKMLADSKKLERKEFSYDKLMIGLECGGSDALSGVTANPSIGLVSDWIVSEGGITILTETTEMIGTSHILEKRAKNEAVASKLTKLIKKTEEEVLEILGGDAARVISPGNMDGGMSTIQEKALGCIRKGGSTLINDILEYGQIPCEKGHLIMDGPGFDTESLTGLAAAGSQILIFSTGRGNPIGHPLCPVIKVASNSKLFESMNDDMDINAGAIIEGKKLQEVGAEMISYVKDVANGKLTKAEINEQSGILCLYSYSRAF